MVYLLPKLDNFTMVGNSLEFRETSRHALSVVLFVEFENGTGWTVDISTLVL
jgi:hypothetical protein